MPVELLPEAALPRAAAHLCEGRLVAFPTETVYGLGGNALDDEAVARIFAAKGRPTFNPLIVHLADAAAVGEHVEMTDTARRLAEAFWPGGLTLVLKRRADCRLSLLVSAGLDTVAVRVPDHPLAQALLREAHVPVAAPSANRSGEVSPTRADHVLQSLRNAAEDIVVLDGGPCALGLESTVIACDGPPLLLRPGAIPREAIEEVLDVPIAVPAEDKGEAARASPGRLLSHYAPGKPLRLNATTVAADEVLLTFGSDKPEGAVLELDLSPIGDLRTCAARLFAALREADASDKGARIAVMPIPEEGLGEAINDRLRRAAAPGKP